MARRKEAMARARRRRKRRDGDLTINDDHIVAMIREMKQAAEVCVCHQCVEEEIHLAW